MPAGLKIAAAVLLAFPFGWGLGVVIAWMIAGPDFGQLPAATIGFSIIGSIVFALWPSIRPDTRLTVLFVGSIVLIALARITP